MNLSHRHSSSLPAILDSVVALGLVVGAVCLANKDQLPASGLADFLSIRVTLLNASFSVVFAVLWKQCLESLGLYRNDFTGVLSLATRVVAACAIMTTLLGVYLEAIHATQPIVPVVECFFVLGVFYEVCRVLISNRLIWSAAEPQRVVILGSGRRAGAAWRELRTRHDRVRQLLGFVDDRDPSAMPPDIAARFIVNVDDLPDYLLKNVVDELIVATPLRSCYDMTQRAVAIAEAVGVRVVCLNGAFSLSHGKSLRKHADLFLDLTPRHPSRQVAETAKRVLDFVGSAAALIVLAPVFVLVGLLIKLTSPGPVFFVQRRYGFGRRCFDMYKFRSMVRDAPKLQAMLETQNEAQGPIFKMKDDPRITPLGRFLRRSSLDELPQLWNVFIGDMSLVGPRPMSVRDVSLFSDAQLMRRFSVRPGITGSWQVSGRSSLSFDQWMTLDFLYIDDWSILLDLKILARTVPAVLKRSGAV